MRTLVALAFAALLFGLALGCSKSTKPAVNTNTAQQETDLGNQALAAGDYATANAHYKAAIAKDPANAQGQFGAAVTEVYLLQADPEIQAVQNELPHARAPFTPVAPMMHTRTERAAALFQRLAGIGAGTDQRYSPKSLGTAFFRTLLLAADDPDSISEVQAIIRNKVMPKLQYAEDRLNLVEAAADFVMLLPPAVTELPDTIEIDKTEAYVLDAVVNGLQGWCGILVAYNFDVENSDFEHVNPESLFTPGTAWAKLNTGAGVGLGVARSDFLNVKSKLDAAATYLTAETDDQSDDVIPQSWLATQDYTDLHDSVNQVYASLSGPVTITVNDANQQPMDIQIQIGNFFVPAIQDLKTKFPDLVYSVDGPQISSPITFPDPLINGIFPDMTNLRWQQLTGLSSSPALHSPAARPVAVRLKP